MVRLYIMDTQMDSTMLKFWRLWILWLLWLYHKNVQTINLKHTLCKDLIFPKLLSIMDML